MGGITGLAFPLKLARFLPASITGPNGPSCHNASVHSSASYVIRLGFGYLLAVLLHCVSCITKVMVVFSFRLLF